MPSPPRISEGLRSPSEPDLDPRLEGRIAIPRFTPRMTRSKLIVNGPVRVEGRLLSVGERVRVTTGGGEIKWN